MLTVKKVIANIVAKVLGWKIQGEIPGHIQKMVMIGAPHTSNWDLFTTLCCAWHYKLQVHWLGKESLFSNPFIRTISKILGGIKVDRTQSDQTVDRISKAILASKKRVCLVIAPEGTRTKKSGWRSGFYYIAKKANIPIGLGFTNYANRTMGVGRILTNVEDLDQTMTEIQDFYKNIVGKYPDKQSPIKLVSKETGQA